MAVSRCQYCGQLFGHDRDGVFYDSAECRELDHRRLTLRSTPARDVPLPPSGTPIYAAFEALADEDARYDSYTKRMRR